jgi:hypothetical protein
MVEKWRGDLRDGEVNLVGCRGEAVEVETWMRRGAK